MRLLAGVKGEGGGGGGLHAPCLLFPQPLPARLHATGTSRVSAATAVPPAPAVPLQSAAVARASNVHKSIRVKKAKKTA